MIICGINLYIYIVQGTNYHHLKMFELIFCFYFYLGKMDAF